MQLHSLFVGDGLSKDLAFPGPKYVLAVAVTNLKHGSFFRVVGSSCLLLNVNYTTFRTAVFFFVIDERPMTLFICFIKLYIVSASSAWPSSVLDSKSWPQQAASIWIPTPARLDLSSNILLATRWVWSLACGGMIFSRRILAILLLDGICRLDSLVGRKKNFKISG